ncbi:ADP-ribosylation factor-like protein 2-binding protein [Trichogramma pretiosum]|uniref:ADP-ribosylation factor-like protein 2-binding protein n=1 Tax=Trichogramma kaykai TaxID=54128 RepID=A0ABD2XJC0_9HYME|nr:ADP-ribosylation factor-like protein 2-binding protein [Trichogramma pretiosum]
MSKELLDSPTSIEIDDFQEKDTREPNLFDKTIGYIEDLLMDEQFQSLQQNFLDKYWREFEPVEENKLIYTDVFNEYNKIIESYITVRLEKSIPNFSMEGFISELNKRRSELDGEVFDVLLTFTDFLAFKELILDYRAVQEGKVFDLSDGIIVKPLNLKN